MRRDRLDHTSSDVSPVAIETRGFADARRATDPREREPASHRKSTRARAAAASVLWLGLGATLSVGPLGAGPSPAATHLAADPAASQTPRSPALRAIHASAVWPRYTGQGVTVAVIDSGVDGSVADLRGHVLDGVDMVDPWRADGWHDAVAYGGHGTGVASLVAGTGLGSGVYGVAPQARVLPVRILNRRGWSPDARVGVSIRWAVDHGADVINLSLGTATDGRQPISNEDRRSQHAAVRYAVRHGVTLVAAAGNDGPDNTKFFPAAFREVIAVGGTSQAGDHVAGFSDRGDWVDVVAPAVDVWNTNTDGSRGVASGTSLAAPAVAGAVALMLSARPDLTPAAVQRLLMATAHDLGPPGLDPDTGAGLVDVAAAVGAGQGRPKPS